MVVFKGPKFGFSFFLMAGLNLLLLIKPSENLAIYIAGIIFLNVFFYYALRAKMNYFIVEEDRLIVKNSWRPNFVKEIPYKSIHFVDKAYLIREGLHLALATSDNPGLRISCSNLGNKKTDELVTILLQKIKASFESIHTLR